MERRFSTWATPIGACIRRIFPTTISSGLSGAVWSKASPSSKANRSALPSTCRMAAWIRKTSTDSGKPMNECYINEILYKKTTLVKDGETQDFVTFDFPLDLTMDQLKANAGEPTGRTYHNEDNPKYIYDTLEWTKKGTKFMNSNRYSFDYTNGELREVTITYIP